MKELPDSFWATIFIMLATLLAIVTIYAPPSAEKNAVVTMASSIITGAFGYIQGKKSSADSVQVPPNPTASTTVSVVPTQPVDPAKK